MNLPHRRPSTHSSDPAFDALDDHGPFAPKPQKTISLMARAVGYLSRREHSQAELARKLAAYAASQAEVAAVITQLSAKGMLSDARYAQSLVHRRGAKFGTARVVQELKAQGVQGAALEQAQATLKESDLARCKQVWQRKFGSVATSREEAAKQARFLAQRGFAMPVIMRVVKGVDDREP
jgi:regulatory protein